MPKLPRKQNDKGEHQNRFNSQGQTDTTSQPFETLAASVTRDALVETEHTLGCDRGNFSGHFFEHSSTQTSAQEVRRFLREQLQLSAARSTTQNEDPHNPDISPERDPSGDLDLDSGDLDTPLVRAMTQPRASVQIYLQPRCCSHTSLSGEECVCPSCYHFVDESRKFVQSPSRQRVRSSVRKASTLLPPETDSRLRKRSPKRRLSVGDYVEDNSRVIAKNGRDAVKKLTRSRKVTRATTVIDTVDQVPSSQKQQVRITVEEIPDSKPTTAIPLEKVKCDDIASKSNERPKLGKKASKHKNGRLHLTSLYLKLPDLRHVLRPRSPSPGHAPHQDSVEYKCWIVYKKLKEKEVRVSYDVIKRGMLTPSEYKDCSKPVSTQHNTITCDQLLIE